MDRQPAPPVRVRSFAAALFLIARGFEPIAAEPVPDGSRSRSTAYFFPRAAEGALDDYFDAKDRLDVFSRGARSAASGVTR
jgi:hypothetical protein